MPNEFIRREHPHRRAVRLRFTPLPVINPHTQSPASAGTVFRVHKRAGDYYSLYPELTDGPCIHNPNGLFLFVIKVSRPGTIYVAAPRGSAGAVYAGSVVGHTSISLRENVLYAGEIWFHHGQLHMWSNNSGHYKPPAALYATNLLPSVKLLLPQNKFVNSFSSSNISAANELLVARGYEVIPG